MTKPPNHGLIGRPGSRAMLSTPALLLEVDTLDRNIQAMAYHTRSGDVHLRPHCKGHKSLVIARRQMAAGALGISCATLGEAETMAAGGIGGLLITSPVTNPAMISRLLALNEMIDGLLVAIDNPLNLEALNHAAAGTKGLSIVVDFDVGQGRTGAATEADAVALAEQASASASLRFAGLQAYYGHLQHVAEAAERERQIHQQQRRIRTLCDRLRSLKLAPGIVTGGGTGSYAIDCASGVFTEIQPGSYPFLDREYCAIELPAPGSAPFAASLFVRATVVSLSRPGRATVNAGYKSFATESVAPQVIRPELPGAAYQFMGDEHGLVTFREGTPLAVGDAIEFLVPHCDPTINLYDWYHCVRGDQLVDLWPVDARGK